MAAKRVAARANWVTQEAIRVKRLWSWMMNLGQRRVAELSALRLEVETLKSSLRESQEAQERSALQLVAERALRQSAEARSEKYHDELVAAIKASANWASKNVNRRAIFSDVDSPEPEPEPRQVAPIGRGKQFAREVGRQVTDKTLSGLLQEIREQREPESDQVGPEFSSVG